MSLSKVIDTARGELGYTESPPGSNRTKYWDEYDKAYQGQPWCVSGLWWVFQHAGEGSAFFGGAKTASCGTLLRRYKEQGMIVPFTEAQAGDIVFLTFHGGTLPEHCGLVTERTGVLLKTIEFNTTPGLEGSQDNGGCVAAKVRYPYQVVAVARPKYKEEPMPTQKDYEGRWSEQDMRWADEAGLIKGYEDGTYRPTQAMTREEVVALLHRYDAAKELGKL